MSWRVGTVAEVSMLTPSARSLLVEVTGWPGNLPGQHVDVRLTADDGYQAVRSYSLASSGPGSRVELAVDRVPDGEVSPYLVDVVEPGDQLEIRGPLGGWFVWRADDPDPVQLIGGGSGVVPLMAMARAHAATTSTASFRLLHSVRTPADTFYGPELAELEAASAPLAVDRVFTRAAPPDWPDPVGRITRATLERLTIPPSEHPAVFVCGPTPFVEAAADWLVELGHPAGRIKTERFGGA